ncbi:hypothetical protein Bpfe_026152, partial [Biomphalaria pfeifferi]
LEPHVINCGPKLLTGVRGKKKTVKIRQQMKVTIGNPCPQKLRTLEPYLNLKPARTFVEPQTFILLA